MKEADTIEKEICVRCGRETPYDISTPVSIRLYFVEGAGQLCEECWLKLYERGNQLEGESYDKAIEADLKYECVHRRSRADGY